jgi:hypothetical protein
MRGVDVGGGIAQRCERRVLHMVKDDLLAHEPRLLPIVIREL